MNSTLLLAVVALGLGLLLAAGGSVLLAHARAAARTSASWQSSISQYPAALSALMGFLVTGAAGGVLCWRLAPLPDGAGALVAIATGVVLFALAGTGFARLADRVENRRVHRVPDEVRQPVSPARAEQPALPPSKPEPEEPQPEQPREEEPDRLSTPLVEVRRGVLEPRSDRPAPTVSVRGERGRPLEAGWMYRDEAGAWFLAVGTPSGGALLLGLPAFTLVDPNGPDAPVGALLRAGAGELTVLPDDPGPAALPSPPAAEAPGLPAQRTEGGSAPHTETGSDPDVE